MQQETKSSTRKTFQWIGLIVILLLIANFGYQLYKRNSIKNQYASQSDCDIQKQSCTINMRNNMSVILDITPKPFHTNELVTVTATIKGMMPENVSIFSFPKGQTIQAKPISLESTAPDQFTASYTIPKTESSNHQWVLMLIMQAKGQSYALPFHFKI